MTMRQAPAANNNNTLLLMAFFSPLLSSLLWLLIAPSRVSAFTAVTVTSTRLSSSSSISSEVNISNGNGFQLRRRRRRRDHHHQEDDHRSSASNHPSLTILHMSSLSTTSSDDDGERQEGTTLDVSSYMFPIANDDETKDYIMQQTMIRVKDPIQSLDFYCNILGFRLIHYSEFPQWKFNVYFVAPVSALTTSSATIKTVPSTRPERWQQCMTTPGCIELTWNYGTEKEEGLVYNTGNADGTGVTSIPPSSSSSSFSSSSASGKVVADVGDRGEGAIYKVRGGFGHLGITVPNVYEACARLHSLGVPFHKSPNMGGMKGLAFIKDPDGYLIEVLPQGPMVVQNVDCLGVEASIGDGEGYRDNSK